MASARVKPPNGKKTGPDVWFRAEIARPGLGGSLSESPGASQGESWRRGPSLRELGPWFLGITCPCRARVQPSHFHRRKEAPANHVGQQGVGWAGWSSARPSRRKMAQHWPEKVRPAYTHSLWDIQLLYHQLLRAASLHWVLIYVPGILLETLKMLKSRVSKPRWLTWGTASIWTQVCCHQGPSSERKLCPRKKGGQNGSQLSHGCTMFIQHGCQLWEPRQVN